MSAYVVDDKTISVLVKAFEVYHVDYCGEGYIAPSYMGIIFNMADIRKAIGQNLLDHNYRSVNYRYNEEEQAREYQYEDLPIDEGLVYGCISNYIYQACEVDDFFESDVYKSLQNLKDGLLKRLITEKGQKMYWGYDGIEM